MGKGVRDVVLSALIIAVTSVLSLVSIPLPLSPVPVTGQTLGVFLAGILLPPGQGALAMFAYLLLGIAGAPVFAGGTGGLGVLFGPTGGFLFGFVPAAAVIALVRGKGGVARLGLAVLAGLLTYYAFGVLWLARVAELSLAKALALGILPYLPGDLLKAVVAGVGGLKFRRWRRPGQKRGLS